MGRSRLGLWALVAALATLEAGRVTGDTDPPEPIYLPAALEPLDVPEYFRLQQTGHYPPANASLDSRTETFLFLRSRPAAWPLVRASYPPFTAQQEVPGRTPESNGFSAAWDVRAVSVEASVSPAEPQARVLFHLKGQDWLSGHDGLPCARLHATHPAGSVHGACRFRPPLGACVVELEVPWRWFSAGPPLRAELAYSLEPAATAAEGLQECDPMGRGDPTERLRPVGWVEIQPSDPPRQQEVPLDPTVRLRVPDTAVRPGQVFGATLLLRHNFTANMLTLRIKVKKGLHVTAAHPAHPALWTARLDRFKGSKHHTALVTCHRTEHGHTATSPLGFSEFLRVDFAVENSTGGLAVTRPVTWQLEYPGQAPEAEKDKMVWEIQVSDRDIRALVPLAKEEELVNTSPLTGVPRHVPVRLVTVDRGGAVTEVTEQIGCESANTQVLQVSELCDAVSVGGKESRGARGVRVDFWWRRLRASLRLTVWAPLLPLRIELTDTTLEQVRGWRVPAPADGEAAGPEEAGEEPGERRARGCRLQYQRAGVRFLASFVAHPLDGSHHLTYLLGPDWLLDVSHLVGPHARVLDPRVATLEAGSILVGREPGVTSVEVRSPLSDSILGEQALAVTDDKVSVSELRAQLVTGVSLVLIQGSAHPWVVTASCRAHRTLRSPKQEAVLSIWLAFSDHTLAPAELYEGRVLTLSVASEEPGTVSASPGEEPGAPLRLLLSGEDGRGFPIQVGLYPPESCRRGKHRTPLASGTAWAGDPPTPSRPPELEEAPPEDRGAWGGPATESGRPEERRPPRPAGGGEDRGKFGQPEEDWEEEGAGGEDDDDEEEEEEEEEIVRAPKRMTDIEMVLYALLGIFCLAIFVFLINGVIFMLRYRRKEPPDAPGPGGLAAPQPHNWVWLGTDQEELSRQLDRWIPREEQPPSPAPPTPAAPAPGAGGCHCESGDGSDPPPDPAAPSPPPPASTLSRKEPGGRRKRVEFVTFTAGPAVRPLEEPPPPAVQSILVAGEEDIRWVCEDMGLRDPDELRSYMERIRGSS
ncbi:transmembrane protein 132A [Tachyglossus aculeatus]|uniref:transmembrane protein 132A n=1 Tax=Tachyglossus aculeatus TaxID=9261 RepID=UPI0018F49858|nr:transmembrane protein 132A [Tachyglossus aculeatus]